ncbi:MAG: hypothetical protein ACTSUF_07295 [Candidatus Heimdallarchaeaceae archaeon]
MAFERLITFRGRSLFFIALAFLVAFTPPYISVVNNSQKGLVNKDALNSKELNIFYPKSATDVCKVVNYTGVGEKMPILDSISTYQLYNLSFLNENSRTNSFFIDSIDNFSANDMRYNITKLIGIADFYDVENRDGIDKWLSRTDFFALAQQFNVFWNHAVIYGFNLTLLVDRTGDLGSYNLDLMVVKANDTGYPDLNQIKAYAIISPYNESNWDQLTDSFAYFSFPNVLLEKGSYFLVANLSKIDPSNPSKFSWQGKFGASETKTCYMDNTGKWRDFQANFDLSLIVHMMPANSDGTPYSFENPRKINLIDNGTAVNSLDEIIFGTGLHTLSVNTSVFISMNNSYVFTKMIDCLTHYSVNNSTFGDFSVQWSILWNTSQIGYIPYASFSRYLKIFCPKDWSDNPILILDNASILFIEKTSDGYFVPLNSTSSGNFVLYSSSPNYVSNALITSNTGNNFFLGHWEKNGSLLIGFEGSTICINISITDTSLTGILNTTIYDPYGRIVPVKSIFTENIQYNDTSSYSTIADYDSTSGNFISKIALDPSINGSDVAGVWTVVVFWYNGTEAGLVSKQIEVKAQTSVAYSWEQEVNSGLWTTDRIWRFSGEELKIKLSYYTISEFNEEKFGYPFVNQVIAYYNSSWNTWGVANLNNTENILNLHITAPAGEQYINFTCEKLFYATQKIVIPLNVFYKYSVQVKESAASVVAMNNQTVRLAFRVINESDVERVTIPIAPEEINVSFNGVQTPREYYSLENSKNGTVIELNVKKLGIITGHFNVSLTIQKKDFRQSTNSSSLLVKFQVIINDANSSGKTKPLNTIFLFAGISFILIVALLFYVIWRLHTKQKADLYAFYQSSSSIVKILVVHAETSLPVVDFDFHSDFAVDTTLVSGFLHAVTMLGSELAVSGAGEIKKIEYKNLVVTSSSTDAFVFYIFSKEELITAIEISLRSFALWFDSFFFMQKETWDGNISVFQENISEIKNACIDFFMLWLHYPLKLKDMPNSIGRFKRIISTIKTITSEDGHFTVKKLLSTSNDIKTKERYLKWLVKLKKQDLLEIRY